MELWDLYDEHRKPLGLTHVRGEVVAAGHYHIVSGIWVINSRGEVLLTLRHPDKDDYPNCWENTCGSCVAGETSLQGALRELYEETGIVAEPSAMTLLGTLKETSALVDTYVVVKDVEIADLCMQDGETSEAKWVTWATLLNMIDAGELPEPVVMRFRRVQEQLEDIVKAFDLSANETPSL